MIDLTSRIVYVLNLLMFMAPAYDYDYTFVLSFRPESVNGTAVQGIPFIQLYTRWHIYQIENYIYIYTAYTPNMYIRKSEKCL